MRPSNRLHIQGFTGQGRSGKSFTSSLMRVLHVQVLMLCGFVFFSSGCGDEFGILLKNPRESIPSIIQVTPSAYNFGNLRSGQLSSDATFTVTNTGTSSVAINSTILSDTTNFTLTPSGETSIASGASITFTVRFNPTTIGTKSGTVTISHDATGSPSVINISGVGMPGEIYWTGSDGTINCVNRDGSGNQVLLTIPGIPIDIELYIPDEQIYWTEYTGSEYRIRRASLDASNAVTFNTDLYNSAAHHGPTTIAVDPANGYIYYSVYKTNAFVNDIWRSALDTFSASKWKTPNRDYTYGLCLDTTRNNMYFTVNNYWDVISPAAGSTNTGNACYGNYETALSGFSTPVTETGPLTDSVPLRDIAVDGASGRIFYVINDSGGMRIISKRFDFQEPTIVLIPSQANGIQKIALDLAARKIYWTTDTGNYIYRADLDTANSNIEVFLTLSTKPNGIVVVP